MEVTSAIHVKRIAQDPQDQIGDFVLVLQCPDGRKRIDRAVWVPLNQTIISGGDDAVIRIWDTEILQEEIGGVKGHFGPIKALALNPDGKSFSSRGEDGYIRLHHFDSDYFNIKI